MIPASSLPSRSPVASGGRVATGVRSLLPPLVRWCLLLAFAWLGVERADAAPPENFAVEDVLLDIEQPMSMRFLPDGRLLVIQKKGEIRILDTSTTPATAATYLNLAAASHADGINSSNERGLLDIALDPNFPAQPYVYVFYTPATGPDGQRSRVARFTHLENGGGLASRADPASEVILWQDTDGYNSCCHYGGSVDFGPDGKLWVTVGDHFQGSYATNLEKAGGGVIRINKDGSIPADNPWVDGAGPNHDALFAKGLRNPFRARWDLVTGRFYIAEVGGNEQEKAWEDLHVIEYDAATGRFLDGDFGTAADNSVFDGLMFGWPTVEGLPPHPEFPGADIQPVAEPVFAYRHDGVTAAINGGFVYRGTLFPAEYQDAYFYADSTRDFIRYLKFNPDGSVAPNPQPDPLSELNPDTLSHPFDLAPIGRIVSLEQGPDGALYYLSFTDSGGAYGVPNPTELGAVRRYVYDSGNARPVVEQYAAEPATGDAPLTVNFTFTVTDPEADAMTYVLHFGDGTTSGAPQPLLGGAPTVVSHTYPADGIYPARLEVTDGTSLTTRTLTIEAGIPPVITALTASNHRAGGADTSFRYGDTFTFSATATDAEDGLLPGSAFTWTVHFVRPGNVHPALDPLTGPTAIDFTIPAQGQGFSGPVYYRVSVTVTDSSGLSATATTDIHPEKSNLTFTTAPAGIVVQIDGNTAQAAPFVLDTLINLNHTISVPAAVCINGTEHAFTGWSNGVTSTQQVVIVPATDLTLTAHYSPVGPCAEPPSDGLVLHLASDAGVVLDGDNVVVWEDQSASGNHLSAVNSPAFVAAGLNGQNFIHLEGSDDALARTGFVGLPTGSNPRTVMMLVRYHAANATTGGWAGFAYGSRAYNQVFGLALTPDGNLGVQGWGRANDHPAAPPVDVVGQWITHTVVYDGSTLTQFHNGSPVGTARHTFATGTTGIRLGEELGGGKNLNMDVAEVLVYDRALDAPEREQAQQYLVTKFASGTGGGSPPTVAITAPTSHRVLTVSDLPLTLNATATDPEDGDLGAELYWTSNVDGPLGIGASLTTSLSPATHLLTATVVDSDSHEASDTVTVTVTDGETPAPPPVTEGLVLHLEADLNVATNSGDVVAGWLDQSGLGNDLVAGGDPRLVASATPSGLPALRFDGTDDLLERVHAHDPLGALPIGNANRTAFLVARYDSTSWWGGFAYGTAAKNRAFGLGVKHPSGELVLQGSGKGNDLIASTVGLGAGWLIQSARLENSTATLFTDGAPVAAWSHVYDTSLTRLVIGRDLGNLGSVAMDVAAVLLYDRALTPAEHELVTSYLHDKYLAATPADASPVVAITSPPDGTTFNVGQLVTFTGTASDAEDGDLASGLVWASDLAGPLGTGASVSTSTLAAGTHIITASVVDRAGQTATASVAVVIGAPNEPPVVTITAPADASRHSLGTSVTFSATATDAEDGDLAPAIVWTSSLDGEFGTGATVTIATLREGSHTITATAIDAGDLPGEASISLTLTASEPAGALPVTAGLVLHLEASQGLSTEGGAITAWADASDRGNDVTAFNGPQILPAATPTGQPAVQLDGVNDRFERLHASQPLNGFPTGNADRTMILVARYLSTTWWGGAAYGTAAPNRAFGLIVKHPSGELGLQGSAKGNDLVSTTAGLGAGWIVQTGLLASSTATLFKDGSAIAQFPHVYDTQLTRLVIGQDLGKVGHVGMEVAAVLLYDRALTPAERAQVEAYLRERYIEGGSSAPGTP